MPPNIHSINISKSVSSCHFHSPNSELKITSKSFQIEYHSSKSCAVIYCAVQFWTRAQIFTITPPQSTCIVWLHDKSSATLYHYSLQPERHFGPSLEILDYYQIYGIWKFIFISIKFLQPAFQALHDLDKLGFGTLSQYSIPRRTPAQQCSSFLRLTNRCPFHIPFIATIVSLSLQQCSCSSWIISWPQILALRPQIPSTFVSLDFKALLSTVYAGRYQSTPFTRAAVQVPPSDSIYPHPFCLLHVPHGHLAFYMHFSLSPLD